LFQVDDQREDRTEKYKLRWNGAMIMRIYRHRSFVTDSHAGLTSPRQRRSVFLSARFETYSTAGVFACNNSHRGKIWKRASVYSCYFCLNP